ncbi:MAG: DUF1800 domain-containing protein [Spirochaetota bacterium]
MYSRYFILFLLLPHFLFSMSFEEARHLLSRTSFGIRETEVRKLMRYDYEAGVDFLLKNTYSTSKTKLSLLKAKKQRKIRKTNRMRLQAFFYKELIETPSPLTEKMVLFWHNHFVSSLAKVKPEYMYKQNQLFRQYALGNFRELLLHIPRDPAMIVYLDLNSNREGNANENFARELLELFTLGEGKYTETDIKEAARAFTGYSINHREGTFRFVKRKHDMGKKTFMGLTRRFTGEDIITDVLLEKRGKEIAYFITRKLWLEFVSKKVKEARVKQLGKLFYRQGFEIKPLLKAILMSSEFRSSKNYGTMIKSPIELIVGTIRTLSIDLDDTKVLLRLGKQMGQDILTPPNVKGWPGGNKWISSHSLSMRKQFVNRLVRGQEMGKMQGMMQMNKSYILSLPNTSANRNRILKLLLPRSPVSKSFTTNSFLEYVHDILLDPVYQLK